MLQPIFVNEDVVWQSSTTANRLFFGRTSINSGIFAVTEQIILVSEDVIFERRDYNRLLMFGKAPTAGGGQPFSLLKNSPPPWNLFEDKFFAAHSVLEIYGEDQALTPGSQAQPFSLYFRPSYRAPEVEDEYKRVDHQRLFSLRNPSVAQLVGYTFDQPDFNDHPWLEWVPLPKNPASQLVPFRQIPTFVRGQQFSMLFYQAPYWKQEAEPDSLRKTDHGVFELMWGRPFVIPPITFTPVPNFVGMRITVAIHAAAAAQVTIVDNQDPYYLIDYNSQFDPQGLVIQQDIPGGTTVPIGQVVRLIIGRRLDGGSGSNSTSIPNIYPGSIN